MKGRKRSLTWFNHSIVHRFDARGDIGKFHAADAVGFALRVRRDLAVKIGRRAEIMTTRSDAARVELFVYNPVN